MKKLVAFVVVLICILFYQTNTRAESNYDINLKFEAGMEGKVKMYHSFPLKVIAENNGKQDFSGDLLIRFAAGESSVGGRIVSVHLGAGQSRTYSIVLPGVSDYGYYNISDGDDIRLFEGDWQEGKQIEFNGSKKINLNFIDSTIQTVGLLSENPDRLASVRGFNQDIQFLNLDESLLPEDSMGLEMLDILLIDEFPFRSLSIEKQESIMKWLNNGGILLVGGVPNATNSFGDLSDLLPLKIKGETKLQSPSLSNLGTQSVNFSELQIFTGEFDYINVLEAYDNIPLILSEKIGNGQIYQTAFSIGDAPVIQTSGYSEWLTNFLVGINSGKIKNNDFYYSLYWNFGEINEIFSGSTISSGQLVLILIIYLIMIVPVLYFVLRRKDKREYAWWIIPAISIVTSILIFSYGAKDRILNPLMNEMGIFVADDNYLNGYMTVSMQSNTSGDYSLTARKNDYSPIPLYSYNASNVQFDTMTYFEEEQGQMNIRFPNVEYWSIRSVFGQVNKQLDGMFDYNLTIKDQSIVGSVTNHFPYDFDTLFIWSGMNEFELGEVKKGETIKVEVPLPFSWLSSPVSPGYMNVIPHNELDNSKSDALKQAMSNGMYFSLTEPVIAGLTKDSIIDLSMEDKNVKTERKSLIVQPFSPSIDYQGEVTLEHADFDLTVKTIKGNFPDPNPYMENEIYLEPGTYQLIYEMPAGLRELKINIEKLKLSFNYGFHEPFYIYNFRTDEYELMNDLGNIIEFTEHADDYLSKENKIILQIEKTNMDYDVVFLPHLSMEGSVQK